MSPQTRSIETPDAFPQAQPYDEHNQNLMKNVHPFDWTNPEPDGRYNMVVVGAGTAGLVTAAGTAGLGGKVALIESDLMGGDCLNVGCVPSKALILPRSWKVCDACVPASANMIRSGALANSVWMCSLDPQNLAPTIPSK
jgi:hypothetical protein